MAQITITLSDTPTGGVAVHTDFKPAIGQPCTPAQGHALEIINRTHKQWGLAGIEQHNNKQGAAAGALEVLK